MSETQKAEVEVMHHDIIIGQQLHSDDTSIPFAVFQGHKKGLLAKAYRKGEKWVLVSDQRFKDSGLIIFINNSEDKKVSVGDHIAISKVLPNVAFGTIQQ